MLSADLSDLPLLSRRQAEDKKLAYLELKRGMSLISCSGTIGRMAYARPEMEGMWSSQHIMKVVPDPARVPSGYLYAFLSTKFGLPLVVSGTYGSIIQEIGPHHIADLPVPRLGDALEQQIHALVEQAAELRTKASAEFRRAVVDLERTAGLPDATELADASASRFVVVESSHLEGRLDTNFHRPWHYAALRPFRAGKIKGVELRSLAESIVEPLRFKRNAHDDEDFAVPFYGTGSLGDIDPRPLYRISRFPGIDDYRVNELSVLIPRSGQIYGIIGTAFQPIGLVLQSAVTEDAIRVNCSTAEQAGYVFLALRRVWPKTTQGASLRRPDTTPRRCQRRQRSGAGSSDSRGCPTWQLGTPDSPLPNHRHRPRNEARSLIESTLESHAETE